MRWLRRLATGLLAVLLLLGAAFAGAWLFAERRLPVLLSYPESPFGTPSRPSPELERRTATRAYMGGIPAHLTCVGLEQAAFDALMTQVDARIEALTARWSTFRADSTLSTLNAVSAPSLEVDADTAALLSRSRALTEATGGVLDVTVGPIVALWKAAEKRDLLPTDDEVAAARALVGPAHWSLEDATVRREPGVRFDVNAIGEGAMADQAVALFRQAGCTRVLIELGGDVGLWHEEGQAPFRIGIDDPSDPSRLAATVEVEGGAIDTSGDYNRFFTIRGVRYGHVVDPRTGRPALPEVASATVVAPDTLTADAWDTALVALGWDEAQRVVEQRPELEAVLMHRDGRRWVSSGLTGKVRWLAEGADTRPGEAAPSDASSAQKR